MKILMVLTSHGDLGNTGEKTGFWIEEFASPYYLMADAWAVISIASPLGGQPPVGPKSEAPEAQTPSTKRFYADLDAIDHVAHTMTLGEVNKERL
jgi:putative intracellular protease/amidase